MTARDQLADVIGYAIDATEALDARTCNLAAADAVLGMIKPLEWGVSPYLKKEVSGRYTVQHEYDANGGSCWVMGFDDWVVSTHQHRDIAKAAANRHHRAQILAALGLDAGEGRK